MKYKGKDNKVAPYGLVSDNGFLYLNEGNHNEKGNPHPQYVSSSSWFSTKNSGKELDKTVKLFDVTYKGDNNYTLDYEFEFNLNSRAETNIISFSLSRLKCDRFYYTKTNSIFIKAVYEDLGYEENDPHHPVGRISVYATISRQFTVINFRCVKSIVNKPYDGATVYIQEKDYALKCINYYENNPFEVNDIIGNVETKFINLDNYGIQTWKEVLLKPNEFHTVTFSASNIIYRSVVSLTLSENLPTGVVTGLPSININDKTISFTLYNASDSNKTVKAMTIFWSVSAGLTGN